MAKSDCMLAIVWLLRSRGRMTAHELAETLEISVRTIYRYVDSLCASGVPIVAKSGHEGGYQLPLHYQSAPLFFTAEERTALAHSALFAQKAGYPFTTALTGALRKIEYNSTAKQMEDLSLHAVGLDVLTTADHSAYVSALADLERAVAYSQTVRIVYRKAKGETDVIRNIDPYGLIHWRDRWYIVGHCHHREDIRTFRVDRISECMLTASRFVRPKDFSASDFFSAQQIAMSTNTDIVTRVVLVGDQDAIRDLAQHWFIGPRLVTQTSSEASFLFEERTLNSYLPHILLAFGRSVRIIEPEPLKQRMIELTVELAAHYQSIH